MSGQKSVLKVACALVVMLPGLLVGCSSSTTTGPTSAGSAAAEPTAAASSAKATLPMTVQVEIEDGLSDVTLQSINWNAESEDKPADGNKLMTALFSFKSAGSGEYEPYRAFEFGYRDADGVTYETSDAMVDKDLFGTGTLRMGTTIEGNVVFEIPISTTDDTGAFLLDVDGEVYTLPLDGSGPIMPTSDAPSPVPSQQPSDSPTSQGPAPTVEVTSDADEGAGPAVLDTPFVQLAIPADYRYEVSTLNYDASSGRGVMVLYLRNSASGVLDFEISTTRMATSLEEAVDECIRTNSYNNTWSPTRGADVVLNGVTYATVTMTKDDQVQGFYVTHYSKGGINHYVEMQVPVASLLASMSVPMDDPAVVAIMESIEYKR